MTKENKCHYDKEEILHLTSTKRRIESIISTVENAKFTFQLSSLWKSETHVSVTKKKGLPKKHSK
jgi:hypothetical protein